jgi:hypothetical protein
VEPLKTLPEDSDCADHVLREIWSEIDIWNYCEMIYGTVPLEHIDDLLGLGAECLA